ncbi:sulfotransferase [Pseudomonas sp. J452]|uniref:sulfotransferase n=1 Tax=Pseudomonas sp. J452 TaxID=2898441 RepID=UPI0021ADB454|nr:sulfotransferase [Pseudomonas sp. J452]UUY09343.1 sulfotransferase [Pseudomonas sp. J452]
MSVDLSFFDNAPLLHIGYPKNLSKWLQKNLFIPEVGFIKYMSPDVIHELLVAKKPFRFDCHALQGKANVVIARARKLLPDQQAAQLIPVVSSEALVGNLFCGGYDAELLAQRLLEAFPQARILIVVREQKQMIRSLYSTAVAWGLPHKLKDFLAPHDENIVPQFNLDFLCYDALVARYQAMFSKERVVVVPYELFKNNPEAFVGEVMKAYPDTLVSTKLKELPFNETVNQGQTIVETKIQRLLNRWVLSTPFNYGGWLKDRDGWRGFRNTWRAPLRRDGYLVRSLDRRLAQEVDALTQNAFAESNRRLSRLIGMDLGELGYEM